MNNYFNPEWKAVLEANKLDSFEKLWELDAEWFEPINHRRGGWSGVSRIQMRGLDGEPVIMFLKRQQNHSHNPLGPLFPSAPTFRREFRNMRRFMKYNIPIAEPIYYGEQKVNGNSQAILLMVGIPSDYRSLENLFENWKTKGFPVAAERQRITEEVAKAVRLIHRRCIRHGCLESKHIFVKYQAGQPVQVRFIDLEKSRYWLGEHRYAGRDLATLTRCFDKLHLSDRLRFYKSYLGIKKLNKKNTRLQRWLAPYHD